MLNHNIETVERLYRPVRPGSRYHRSLGLLRAAKDITPQRPTKSGMMLGLGEQWEEIVQTLLDLRAHREEIVTVGQYLRPSLKHLPIVRYYTPEEFARLKEIADGMGFQHVESGPLVRSSYHAKRALQVS